MTRNLETLIEQFNRASDIDRVSRIATGETFWVEVDGVRTTMVNVWLNELSIQEKLIFEVHLSQVIDEAAIAMGLGSWQQHIKDVGQKIFSGLEMGVITNGAD